MSKKTRKFVIKKQVQPVKESANQWLIFASMIGVVLFVFAAIGFWPKSNVPANFVPEVTGAPRIRVISEPVINHGDLLVNEFVTSTYQIQNVGDEPLTILSHWVQVHEGCCPPESDISSERLNPGEIATVTMSYTMHEGMDGPHDLRIHLQSNDPANPEIELTALSNWQS